jgi:hypothetical protein
VRSGTVAADTADTDLAAAQIEAHIAAADKARTADGHKAAAPAEARMGAGAIPARVAGWPAAAPVRPQGQAALFLWRRSRGIRYTKGALHAHIAGKSR